MWRSRHLKPRCKQLSSCTQPVYKPLFPVAGTSLGKQKIYLRNLCQHFERLILVLCFLTEVCSRLLEQQPAEIARSFFFQVLCRRHDGIVFRGFTPYVASALSLLHIYRSHYPVHSDGMACARSSILSFILM